MTTVHMIDRPPRIQPELPSGEVVIPRPPDVARGPSDRLAQIGLPLLTLVGYIVVSAFGGAQQPLLLIPMALAVVASVGFSLYTLQQEHVQRTAETRAYEARLRDLRSELQAAHELQRRFYHYSYPDAMTALKIARDAQMSTTPTSQQSQQTARLWERRRSDDDFATLHLGIGTRPSTMFYTLERTDADTGAQARAAQKLANDSRYVAGVPITLALCSKPEHDNEVKQSQTIPEQAHSPQAHAVGIAGERNAVYRFARAVLGHYTAFHAPGEARLAVLASERRDWAWAVPLPHCTAHDQLPSFCFTAEATTPVSADELDDDGGDLEQYLERLRRTLAQRKLRAEEHEEQANNPDSEPFLLVVIDLLNLESTVGAPLQHILTDAAIALLLEEGAKLGAAVMFLVPKRTAVPGGCQVVIEIAEDQAGTPGVSTNELVFRYTATGVNSAHYVGRADSLDVEGAGQLAQAMSHLVLRQGSGAQLAATVPFLDLVGCTSMAELSKRAAHRWEASTNPSRADWLRARIGLMAGNKPRSLVFSARRDGVHGIVAGSTGSGKSELLIALITSLATNYDPSTLNIVLIDYKGGGAFREFVALPHCVDIITNLASEGVARMFTAIGAELRRRQALNAETGTKDIVEYRRKGLHVTHQPYPFLFIIIDEFAEMIAERPEYKAELETITRVGRAQGISLILAAQRPSGVTDQMRSNIKFRICLRVETPGESRELLRRADAAFLPPGLPGRGFLQVGNDEVELIQSAYAGGIYHAPQQQALPPVLWLDRGAVVQANEPVRTELYKAVIDTLGALALDQLRPTQRAPWPAALPGQLTLTEPVVTGDPQIQALTTRDYLAERKLITLGQPEDTTLALSPALCKWRSGQSGWLRPLDADIALRPVVGLVDDPAGARQLPLTINFNRSHALIIGAAGSGTTTLLRTSLLSLAASHNPGDAHVYILDLAGRGLSVFAGLPHAGAYISADEDAFTERTEQLIRVLAGLIDRRKTLLAEAGIDNIDQYNRAHHEAPEAAVVVAIDGLKLFVRMFGAARDDVEPLLNRFAALMRLGLPYGLHLVASASQLDDLSSDLLALFDQRLVLQLSEPGDYRALLGASVPPIGERAGRGYTVIDHKPLAFQAALPLDPTGDTRELAELCARMHQQADAEPGNLCPTRIDALPRTVLMRTILAETEQIDPAKDFYQGLTAATRAHWAASLEPAQADWLQVPIGAGAGGHTRTLHLEANRDGVHGLVAGGTGSGKSELLMSLIVGLALRYDPRVLNFVLIDYKGGGAFAPFAELPHCIELLTNLNGLAVRRMFTAIGAEMRRRQRLNAETDTKDIVEYRQRGLHLSHAPYPHLFIIIDEYAEMISDTPEFGAELDSITRVGRAQGVNLLLASQKPVGVSDQMRANIKLRMCLRVEQAETSRELLRRSDAAFLPSGQPGRGYIQVGNEPIELAQMAFSGDRVPGVTPNAAGEQPKLFALVVDLANSLLDAERPRAPWPPMLPTALTLATPLLQEYLDNSAVPIQRMASGEVCLHGTAQAWLEGAAAWPARMDGMAPMRPIIGLADDPAGGRQLPLVCNLQRGHAVVFGAAGWGKTTLLRTLALSLAMTHGPDALHIHALDLGGRGLEPLRALPHLGTLIVPDERGYEERIQQLWRELGDMVDRRKRQFSAAGVDSLADYNAKQGVEREPAVLLLVDNIGELIESFGEEKRDGENLLEQFVALARQGTACGLHIVITAPRVNTLSSKLYSLFTERLTLRIADADDYSAIVGVRVPEVEELPGRGYARSGRGALAFQVALPPGSIDESGQVRGEAQQIRAIAAQMQTAATALRSYDPPLRIDALPKSVSMQDVLAQTLGIKRVPGQFMHDLTTATRARWERNASAEHADWLRVPVGIVSGGRMRVLRLEAKHDGVHGMIAGGTGSGKSELLMSLIVGLALNYPPEILNFVLVDYKGGGAFAPFARLPHCVDLVTNLNPAAVARMFTAIGAEIARRQALNVATATKDIIDYRSKGLHLTHAPYPHLFVIIDEYAEMIDANEDFRQALDSITRVGRAQGVNLLLASQQPKGVSDQMRANIKLRLCLRVEQQDTSRELLRSPDAALLPSGLPGRGYIQVGNEPIELIQVAYAGETQIDDRRTPAIWPDRMPPEGAAGELIQFFDRAVSLVCELAGQRVVDRPWPPFLPNLVSLETMAMRAPAAQLPPVGAWLGGDTEGLWPGIDWASEALRPVVGILDMPSEARQEPLTFELGRNHMAVFGESGSGKTTFLRTLLLSLATTHSPYELHIYGLDLGGRGLLQLEGMPHVGTLVYADEERFDERLRRLLDVLAHIVESRQRMLSTGGANSLTEFNTQAGDHALPAVLLVIDNLPELLDGYEALVESALIPLVRRGLGVGISVIVTANVPTGIPSRLLSLFGERITFRQTNTDRYSDIVGRGAIEIGDIPGRGYVRRDGRPLMFQTALPLGHISAGVWPTAAAELRSIAATMTAHAKRHAFRHQPDPIHTLGEHVLLSDLLKAQADKPGTISELLLGQNDALEPCTVELLRNGLHCLIVGPPRSGRTTALMSIALGVAARFNPDQASLVFIDLQRTCTAYGGAEDFGALPHTLTVVHEIDQLERVLALLENECQGMATNQEARSIYVLIDNLDELSEELDSQRDLARRLATLVRRHGRDGMHVIATISADSTTSELKRRMLAGGLGVALCSAAALGVLNITRTPAALRGGDLPPGRGFLVQGGQIVQIQMPALYDPSGVDRTVVLDRRVRDTQAQAAGQRAAWMHAESQQSTPAAASATTPAGNERMLPLLMRGMHWEQSQSADDQAGVLTLAQQLTQFTPIQWADCSELMRLLRQLWQRRLDAQGIDNTLAQQVFGNLDDESLLIALEGDLDDA